MGLVRCAEPRCIALRDGPDASCTRHGAWQAARAQRPQS
jgi:hypothetical protein